MIISYILIPGASPGHPLVLFLETCIFAQARYAAGTKEILRRTFEGIRLNPTDVIVQVSTNCS
jgi:hypothetical protein